MERRWKNKDNENVQKIQWHPAFVAATKIEFEDEREKLKFESEYQLSKKPMQIDLLILKKVENVSIYKNIGKIFRGNNVLEYKSPTDYMGVDDFYKVYGYACFYKADSEEANSIAIDDITISLVSKKYPRKVIEHLTKERGYKIRKEEEGIYYVEGDIFPIQILVTNRLSKEKNLWLSSLTDQLENDKIHDLMSVYLHNRKNPLYRSVMKTVTDANQKKFKEVLGVRSADEILFDIAIQKASPEMKARVFAQVSEEDREKIRKKAEEEVKEELREKIEEVRKKAEEEARKKAEEEVKEELREKIEEARKKAEEEARKKAEEEVKEELRKEVEVTSEKINILFRKLNQEGRMSEWIRSTEDLEYQRELIREMENGK